MNITTKEREELEALSKDVFGASSRWQTIMKNGYNKPVEQITKKSVRFTKVYHTAESVKTLMLELQTKRNEHLAELKNKQDQEKQVQDSLKNATGSAL